jgi:hypothetical protein
MSIKEEKLTRFSVVETEGTKPRRITFTYEAYVDVNVESIEEELGVKWENVVRYENFRGKLSVEIDDGRVLTSKYEWLPDADEFEHPSRIYHSGQIDPVWHE